jgi:hypothetical protein
MGHYRTAADKVGLEDSKGARDGARVLLKKNLSIDGCKYFSVRPTYLGRHWSIRIC